MINSLLKQELVFPLFLSFFFHLSFVFFYSIKPKISEKKYTVIDLAKHKSYENNLIKSKFIKKKQVSEQIIEKIKPVEKIESIEKSKPIEKIKPIEKTPTRKNNSIENSFPSKLKLQSEENLKFLNDQAMIIYLNKVSSEINRLANNSYPKRSIIRKEQGKVITRITIDKTGSILKINFITKKPKNLVNGTELLFKKKKALSTPPEILFKKSPVIVLEIPINYILR